MDILDILREMNAIARLGKTKNETNWFSDIKLEDETIRWGCVKILGWLGKLSISLQIRSEKLNSAIATDLACIELIEKASFLNGVFIVKESHLGFSPDLPSNEIANILNWVKKNNQPYTFITRRHK